MQLTDLQTAARLHDRVLSGPANTIEASAREIENAYNKAVQRINN